MVLCPDAHRLERTATFVFGWSGPGGSRSTNINIRGKSVAPFRNRLAYGEFACV